MELIPGLALGFLGSLHCIAMCGPLALMLPPGGERRGAFILGRVLYNGGRVLTYMLLGVVTGFAGRFVALAGLQQTLSIAGGILIVIFFLLPAGAQGVLQRNGVVVRLHAILKSSLASLIRRRSFSSLFLIGMLNGLLPCGFVYIALAGAATTGGELSAVLFMAGFGIGTVPVMLGTSLVRGAIPVGIRTKAVRLLPVLTLALAALFVLRGLSLGIPYVSPTLVEQAQPAPGGACH